MVQVKTLFQTTITKKKHILYSLLGKISVKALGLYNFLRGSERALHRRGTGGGSGLRACRTCPPGVRSFHSGSCLCVLFLLQNVAVFSHFLWLLPHNEFRFPPSLFPASCTLPASRGDVMSVTKSHKLFMSSQLSTVTLFTVTVTVVFPFLG